MTTVLQALYGLAMILVGGLKTWLHMGAATGLALPMCSGKVITIPTGQTSLFEQAHCWGCYMLAAGLIVLGFAAYNMISQRRSVTANTD